jgi:hypothetical protein
MKNFIYPVLIFLLPAVILFLPMGNGETFVKLAFGQEGAKKTETKTEGSLPVAGTKKILSDMPYTALVEKNIFNPERKEFPIFPTETIKKNLARPQVVLFGVTLAGDYQSASIVQIGRSLRKGEREMLTLKMGERIGEYKLAKVSSDRIALEAEGDAFEILLYDPKMPKKRTEVKAESKPATITSAQASSTGASDLRKEGGSAGASTSTSPPIGTQKPPVRREAAEGTKEAVQEKASPSQIIEPAMPPMTPSTPSGPAPTPTQIPAPMAPTPTVPPFTPVPLTIPPGMGRPAPLTSGAPTQTPSTGGK